MHKFTARTRHRKRAVDTLFEAQLRGFGNDPVRLRELAEQRQQLSAAQTTLPEYAVTVVNGVANNLARIDSLIATYARDWDIDRILATDLAAMRVAVWEMLENDEVDPRVSIDQAVTIVATIGTDNSPSFVNAVLDKIRAVLASDRANSKNRNSGNLTAVGTAAENGYESTWEAYRAAAAQANTTLATADSATAASADDGLTAAEENAADAASSITDDSATALTGSADSLEPTTADTTLDVADVVETECEDVELERDGDTDIRLDDTASAEANTDAQQQSDTGLVIKSAPAEAKDEAAASFDEDSTQTTPAEQTKTGEASVISDTVAPQRRELRERHTIPQWLLEDLVEDYGEEELDS